MQGASLGGPSRWARRWVGNDIKPSVLMGRPGGMEALGYGQA